MGTYAIFTIEELHNYPKDVGMVEPITLFITKIYNEIA